MFIHNLKIRYLLHRRKPDLSSMIKLLSPDFFSSLKALPCLSICFSIFLDLSSYGWSTVSSLLLNLFFLKGGNIYCFSFIWMLAISHHVHQFLLRIAWSSWKKSWNNKSKQLWKLLKEFSEISFCYSHFILLSLVFT